MFYVPMEQGSLLPLFYGHIYAVNFRNAVSLRRNWEESRSELTIHPLSINAFFLVEIRKNSRNSLINVVKKRKLCVLRGLSR